VPHRPTPDVVSFVVRLPARLHQRATDAAWRQRTSLNKLVIEAVTEHLRRPAPPSTKKGGR
jgi:predicted HicB family RNase H-like nuclease